MYFLFFTAVLYWLLYNNYFPTNNTFPQGFAFFTSLAFFGGFFLFGWFLRSLVRNSEIKAIWDNTAPLIREYKQSYGNLDTGENFLRAFGEGFGEGYAEASFNEGDFVGAVIGVAITGAFQWISEKLNNIGKSRHQIQLEQAIRANLQKIDELNVFYKWFCFMFFAACCTLFFMANSGMFPKVYSSTRFELRNSSSYMNSSIKKNLVFEIKKSAKGKSKLVEFKKRNNLNLIKPLASYVKKRTKKKKNESIMSSKEKRWKNEKDEIYSIISNVYGAWRELNVEKFLFHWSPNAIRVNEYSKSVWNYATISRRRRNAFKLYKSVTTRFHCNVKLTGMDKAKVDCIYDWIGTYFSGRKDSEYLSSEYYILSRNEKGVWKIVENHDYSNYEKEFIRWTNVFVSKRKRKKCVKILWNKALLYMKKNSNSELRFKLEKAHIARTRGVYWAYLTVQGFFTKKNQLSPYDFADVVMKGSGCSYWKGVNFGTAGLTDGLPSNVQALFKND